MEIRSFLAFELPHQILEIVARVSNEAKGLRMDVRWVSVENMHLTLVFMGSVRKDDLPVLEKAVEGACREFGPFLLGLKGAGVFGGPRNPRVLWIGCDGDVGRMGRFRDLVQRRLIPFGVQQETRPFSPHLTLGRFRKDARSGPEVTRFLESYQSLSSPVCTLGDLALFRSDLKSQGAAYTSLNRWPLSGTA